MLRLIAAYAAHMDKTPRETDQMVYIQITRGVAMRDHVMPPGLTPTVFVTANRMYIYPDAERARGVACVTADDFRWKKAHVKSTSLAGAVLSRQLSADVGANETVMFRDGFLSEAATSNVWVVQGGKLIGTPRDNLVLEGIRYGLFETLCREADIPFELRRVSRDEVFAGDELLMSSATKEVLPVVKLDDRTIGNGRPGPIYQRLYDGYQRAKLA